VAQTIDQANEGIDLNLEAFVVTVGLCSLGTSPGLKKLLEIHWFSTIGLIAVGDLILRKPTWYELFF
jgi:hypothetical protein